MSETNDSPEFVPEEEIAEVTEEVIEEEIESEDEPETPEKQTRYQKLANERREAKESADRERLGRESAEREREYYRNLAMKGNQEPEYVDPDEKWRQGLQNQVNQALFSAQDMNDRASYMGKLSNQIYQKYQDRVESTLQEARRQGNYQATREGILALLVGQDALKNSGKKTSAQKEAAARVEKARGEPEGIKPNVSHSKSGELSLSDFESRFGGISI